MASLHISPHLTAPAALPEVRPVRVAKKVQTADIEVLLLSGQSLKLNTFEGDQWEQLQVRAAEILEVPPCAVQLLSAGQPLKLHEPIDLELSGGIQVVKLDLSMQGAWKVDISQGYSFILTVEGADGSFEGESYGTWSNIEVDPRTGSLKASWVSGKYGNTGTLKGTFNSPHGGIYDAFFDSGQKVHSATFKRVK
ncbi:unnamed protein product [Durusdinium trenchii]|uniref:Uncharacterized protein n=1 Tax=Durusdinium trenchii TaxID=1381693 RepID=A0ABP0LJ84_9DINO